MTAVSPDIFVTRHGTLKGGALVQLSRPKRIARSYLPLPLSNHCGGTPPPAVKGAEPRSGGDSLDLQSSDVRFVCVASAPPRLPPRNNGGGACDTEINSRKVSRLAHWHRDRDHVCLSSKVGLVGIKVAL
ncbi:hypothetical protein RRG08_011426 [Elysia crispata]|uniref:Uncharacterized protein n=1 Tax=Elysia crispata TaxID=231223 RepID=A0AAE1AGN5_9GAST|nr:hypothetical protein RRG08_011426 [Elysia crispata]